MKCNLLLVALLVSSLAGCTRNWLAPAVYEGVRTNEMLHERPQADPPMNYQAYERERRQRLEAGRP